MAIDLGRRRCGIAVTDSMRIVATPLATVETSRLNQFVTEYISRESVDIIVAGKPVDMTGSPSDCSRYIEPALQRLRKVLPGHIKVERYDERFTSSLAHRAMIDSGMTRTQRRDKEAVDRMAATIMLNDYLSSKQYRG